MSSNGTSSSTTIIHSSSPGLPCFIFNLDDIQKEAKSKLPRALYEYLASGSGDEQTLAENTASFKRWYLRPRVMCPVSNLSTQRTLFGQNLQMPVFVSPAGVHALCNKDGEIATARACGKAGIIFGLSQHATRSIEQVQTAAPHTNLWYQSYILKDRELTLALIKRAVKAGYKGIFLTVDSVCFGFREADARNSFSALPPPHRLVNYDMKGVGPVEGTYNAKTHPAFDQNTEHLFETNVTWEDVKWLKQEGCRELPLVVKGIMTGEDANFALDAGADGIMVSNHGGRQLDGSLSTIDALPEVIKAVAGRGAPVLLDGGIRRGTDILKALALGATAVGIGKPVFFSLAVGGEEGVVQMLDILKTELEAAMALCGCQNVRKISSKNIISRHPYTGPPPSPCIRSSL